MVGERDESFQGLYDGHFERVVGYLVRIGVPRDEACEIAQDAFMRVYDNMENVRGSPVVYLYTTARNLARNRHRDAHALKRDGVRVSLDGIDPASRAPSAESILVERETRDRIRFAIGALPKGMQQALLLRLDGRSYKDISRILGITIDAVKSGIHDAKVRLREQLGEETPGTDDPESEGDG